MNYVFERQLDSNVNLSNTDYMADQQPQIAFNLTSGKLCGGFVD